LANIHHHSVDDGMADARAFLSSGLRSLARSNLVMHSNWPPSHTKH